MDKEHDRIDDHYESTCSNFQSISREKCVVCGNYEIDELHRFDSFPVFMGCSSDFNSDNDLRMDMIWGICDTCGTIQLKELVPLDLLYQANHNDAIGSTWSTQHKRFSEFILKHKGNKYLEIGGASGKVANLVSKEDNSNEWYIVEPNPIPKAATNNVRYIDGWFDEKFQLPLGKADTIIHSFVMEHFYNPLDMVELMSNNLDVGGKVICAVPLLDVMLKKKMTNALNFEHTYYLDESICEWMYNKCGFKTIDKQYSDEINVFFAFEKTGECSDTKPPNNYSKNKENFEDFISYHNNLVNSISNAIQSGKDRKEMYVFGAHIFTQFLFAFGLKEDLFKNVLDNSLLKIGKRLYGTNLITKSPQCLRDEKNTFVVLKAGIYNDEIKKDIIQNINADVTFL